MNVIYKPRTATENHQGQVISVEKLGEHFYFLLKLADGSFIEAKAVDCVEIKNCRTENFENE